MTQATAFTLEPAAGKDVPAALLAFLNDNKTNNVEIDLSAVKSVSGRHIELLLSAHLQWQAAGQSLLLSQVDGALAERLLGFGLPAQLFSEGT